MDTPLDDPNSTLSEFFKYLNVVFLVIFSMEASLKIIALGFWDNNYEEITPYIKDPWNVIDFVVVVVSFVEVYYEVFSSGGNEDLNSIKALRAFRALRPLRIISKSKDLKVAIQALLSSIPSMFNVIII